MADLVQIEDPADPRLADYRDLRDVSLRKHVERIGWAVVVVTAIVIAWFMMRD